MPLATRASCDTGAAPAYEDVTYIKISQYSLLGQQHPWYKYEAGYCSVGRYTNASLDAHRAVGMIGSFVSAAPLDSFKSTLHVLERHRFFNMRLQPVAALYVDGPEDSVTSSQELRLNNAQGRAFFALLDDLRVTILMQKWETPAAR